MANVPQNIVDHCTLTDTIADNSHLSPILIPISQVYPPHPFSTPHTSNIKMPSTTMRTVTSVAFSLSLSLMLQLPSQASATMNAMTYVGCFSSSQPMTDQGSYTYQTSGYCQEVCYNISMPAMGLTGGSDCYCGSQLPAEGDKVDDSQCSTGCNGYGTENCELRH